MKELKSKTVKHINRLVGVVHFLLIILAGGFYMGWGSQYPRFSAIVLGLATGLTASFIVQLLTNVKGFVIPIMANKVDRIDQAVSKIDQQINGLLRQQAATILDPKKDLGTKFYQQNFYGYANQMDIFGLSLRKNVIDLLCAASTKASFADLYTLPLWQEIVGSTDWRKNPAVGSLKLNILFLHPDSPYLKKLKGVKAKRLKQDIYENISDLENLHKKVQSWGQELNGGVEIRMVSEPNVCYSFFRATPSRLSNGHVVLLGTFIPYMEGNEAPAILLDNAAGESESNLPIGNIVPSVVTSTMRHFNNMFDRAVPIFSWDENGSSYTAP
jgi:hypothetical protein